jgi:hypothetical protein
MGILRLRIGILVWHPLPNADDSKIFAREQRQPYTPSHIAVRSWSGRVRTDSNVLWNNYCR